MSKDKPCDIQNEEKPKECQQLEIGSELGTPVLAINLLGAILANYSRSIANREHINFAGAIMLRQVFAGSHFPPELKVTGLEVCSTSVAVGHGPNISPSIPSLKFLYIHAIKVVSLISQSDNLSA